MASTVIVGSGVVGASAAYHLALRGHRNVIALDRAAEPGRGVSARATSGFRAGYPSPTNVRLSLLARDELLAFRRDLGLDPGYMTVGRLWLADTQAELDALRAALRVQQAEGLIEAMELDRERIGWLNPALDASAAAGAVFCPTDGYLRPLDLLRGYVAAATRLGVRFDWNVRAEGLQRSADGTARGVRTREGVVLADHVVNAAGTWGPSSGSAWSLDARAHLVRRRIVVTAPTAILPVGMPITVLSERGLRVQVHEDRVLLVQSGQAPGEPADAETADDPSWIAAVADLAHRRLPDLRAVPLDPVASWWTDEQASPDSHGVLGQDPDCPNCFVVRAASADDISHAPALGRLVAETILDGRTSIDVRDLAAGRFAGGASRAAAGMP